MAPPFHSATHFGRKEGGGRKPIPNSENSEAVLLFFWATSIITKGGVLTFLLSFRHSLSQEKSCDGPKMPHSLPPLQLLLRLLLLLLLLQSLRSPLQIAPWNGIRQIKNVQCCRNNSHVLVAFESRFCLGIKMGDFLASPVCLSPLSWKLPSSMDRTKCCHGFFAFAWSVGRSVAAENERSQ